MMAKVSNIMAKSQGNRHKAKPLFLITLGTKENMHPRQDLGENLRPKDLYI
jgi:hypothetical protein